MDIVRVFVTAAVLAMSWPVAVAVAQQPATAPAQDLLSKVSRQTQASFCRSQGLLTCLKLEKAECDKRIGPIMTSCLKNPGAMQTVQNENFVRSALLGCVLGAFLGGSPHAKEATACIQRAGKGP